MDDVNSDAEEDADEEPAEPLPDAAIDAWLMHLFPGRTLEELVQINWPRLMRALTAQEINQVEDLRSLVFAGKAKLTKRQWRMIKQHDEWADE